MKPGQFDKRIRYVIVGAWNTLFSYIAFVILYYVTSSIKLHYMVVLILSQIVGLTNAYVCYKLFVFKTKGNVIHEYFRFYLVYGFSFLVNIVLIFLFVDVLYFNPVISQGVIASIVVLISYLGHNNFSFMKNSVEVSNHGARDINV